MKPGTTWLFFVPPGWILGGTIRTIEGDYLVLDDAVYLESVASGHALLSSIPKASNPSDLKKICPMAWGLPNGYLIRHEAILHAAPCNLSLRALAGAEAAAAIEGA